MSGCIVQLGGNADGGNVFAIEGRSRSVSQASLQSIALLQIDRLFGDTEPIYRLVSTLTCSHKLWMLTERINYADTSSRNELSLISVTG